jgi:hypothetical protein
MTTGRGGGGGGRGRGGGGGRGQGGKSKGKGKAGAEDSESDEEYVVTVSDSDSSSEESDEDATEDEALPCKPRAAERSVVHDLSWFRIILDEVGEINVGGVSAFWDVVFLGEEAFLVFLLLNLSPKPPTYTTKYAKGALHQDPLHQHGQGRLRPHLAQQVVRFASSSLPPHHPSRPHPYPHVYIHI